MDLARSLVVREWLHSWKLLWQNKFFVLASIMVDLLFFLAYGFFTAPVFSKLAEHVIIVGSLSAKQLRAVPRPALVDVLFQPPVNAYTWKLIVLLFVLAVVVFVLYWLLQGFAWWLAARIAGIKRAWRSFMTGFFRVNLLWFGLFAIWYVVDLLLDLRRVIIEKSFGQPAPVAGSVAFLFLLVVIYFALISYPLLSMRNAFVAGRQNVLVFVPAFLLVLAQLLAGNFVVRLVGEVSKAVMFVFGALLLFVLLAWSRVYTSRVVRGVGHGV